jgi:hypothetical protein
MSAHIDSGFERGLIASGSTSDDGSHAWLGLVLLLGSSVVAIRGICWLIANAIRLVH